MSLYCFWRTFWFSYFKDVRPTQHTLLRGEEAVPVWMKTRGAWLHKHGGKRLQMKLSHQSVKQLWQHLSHLLLVPRDPFRLDGSQSQAGHHVVQDLRQKHLKIDQPFQNNPKKNQTSRSGLQHFSHSPSVCCWNTGCLFLLLYSPVCFCSKTHFHSHQASK